MSITVNLLPWREELREQQKKQFFGVIGAAAVLMGLIIVLVHFIFSNKIDFQIELNNYLKNEISILDRKITQIEGLQREKERLLARMNIIQELQGNRPNIVRLFDNLVRTVPDGLYLVSITRAGKRILIEGRAESNTRVSKFMRNIESSDWLYQPALQLIEADAAESEENFIGFNLQANQKIKDY